MRIIEYRFTMPMSLKEFEIGRLYTALEYSKLETGAGEGYEFIVNEPYEDDTHGGKGQYTHKIVHLESKLPNTVRILAPRGSAEFEELSWNHYPSCETLIMNPEYMKDNFHIKIDTIHKEGRDIEDNVHNLSAEQLKDRVVHQVDFALDRFHDTYALDGQDPTKFRSEKTGRGPLAEGWDKSCDPVITVYKLVTFEFKWWGLQEHVENRLQKALRFIFTKFHRLCFCYMDQWHGLTMDDIRRLEEKTKHDLSVMRNNQQASGVIDGDRVF